MAQDIMRNANGDVSSYGLACGYFQTETVNGYEVRLSSPSVGTYDVDVFELAADDDPHFDGMALVGWAQFEYLTDARMSFRKAVSQIERGTIKESTGANNGNSWYYAPIEAKAIAAFRAICA